MLLDISQVVEFPEVTVYKAKQNKQLQLPSFTSKGYLYENEKNIDYLRNLRFGYLKFYYDKEKESAKFRLFNNKNKWLATWIYEKERLLYVNNKQEFRQGLASLTFFKKHVGNLFATNESFADEKAVIERNVICLVNYVKAQYKHKSLVNVFFKFWNTDTDSCKLNTSSYFYRKLRKCKGLNDATKLIFGVNDKYLRELLLKLNDSLCSNFYQTCEYLYFLRKTLKFKQVDLVNYVEQILKTNTYRHIIRNFKTVKALYLRFYKNDIAHLRQSLNNTHNKHGAFWELKKDCLRMSELLPPKIAEHIFQQKLNVKREHDLLVYLTNNLKDLPNYYLPRYAEYDSLKPQDDTYRYEYPSCSNDLRTWGQDLRICIGAYGESILNGYTYCFSAIDADGNRWCIEHNGTELCQLKGYRNCELSKINPVLYAKITKDLSQIKNVKLHKHEKQLIVTKADKDNEIELLQQVHDWLKKNK